jgi:glycosyltransferase involved in cell wall biosynthesis
MAAAKPVIATNGGGIPEIVVDGETGILVAMGNVPAMASAMLWMLQHPSEAKQMGRKGRERVLRHFSMADSTRKVEMAFESVLRIGPNAKGRGFIG